MPLWSPEVEVDERLAGQLIAAQFPALANAPVRFLAAGWDNTVFAVDEQWAFRFPRRAIAIPGVERELAVLPLLAPQLEVPIPAPTHIGRPTDDFGWPWFGAPLLDGDEPGPQLSDAARATLAPQLGRLLRTLHAASVTIELPHDPLERVEMGRRVPFAAQQLAELAAVGVVDRVAAAAPLLEAAHGLAPSTRRALVHGDLHFRHLLVDEQGGLCGVIDWGDVCIGDPAMDLHLAWSLLPPAARPAFWAAYGPIDPDQALRARVVGLFLGAVLAQYGAATGLDGVRDEAVSSIDRTLAD